MKSQYLNIFNFVVGLVLSSKTSLASFTSYTNTTAVTKPRVFILSDISNEPDDSESLVRLLLHSDLVDIKGITAVTSTWLRNATYPDQMHAAVDAYAEVYDNLQAHTTSEYPTPEYLHSVIYSGAPVYGTAALASNNSFAAAEAVLEATFSSTEPLYLQAWGGTNVLAQALLLAQNTQNETYLSTFMSRIRIYAISDQDDTGTWIRQNFPQLRYINSIHGWNNYGLAAWPGISGEIYYPFDVGGPDSSLVNDTWIAENIQIGPLGSYYPTPKFIMEGDTPSMLFHLPIGLGSPEHPEWGSWGGRYYPVDITLAVNHWVDITDRVIGQNGELFQSNHATIWRWRPAYQAEIAARVQWSLNATYASAPHPPVVIVNGSYDTAAILTSAAVNSVITLDATGTYDPDQDTLEGLDFNWWQHRDVTAMQWLVDAEVPALNFTVDPTGLLASFTMPDEVSACPADIDYTCQEYHVILEVTKKTGLPLARYKRVIVQATKD